MSAHTVEADVTMFPTAENGLAEPMHSPTPSLLLVFRDLEGLGRDDVQIGAVLSGPPALTPGLEARVTLSFWEDLGRLYATRGEAFRLRYAGRDVGLGRVREIVQR